MSQLEARNFLSQVAEDAYLRQQVADQMQITDDPLSAVATVARANGFDVKHEDLTIELDGNELDDAALDNVAGGTFSSASNRGIIIVNGKSGQLGFGGSSLAQKGIIIVNG